MNLLGEILDSLSLSSGISQGDAHSRILLKTTLETLDDVVRQAKEERCIEG